MWGIYIFAFIVFVVITTYYTLQRKWSNYTSEKKAKEDVRLLRNKSISPQEFSQNLKVNYFNQPLETLWSVDEISDEIFQRIPNIQVLHTERLEENRLLVLTLSKDFDIEMHAKERKGGLNYVLVLYPINYIIAKEDNSFVLYSNYTDIGIEKSLRRKFGKAVCQEIVRSTVL